MKFPGDLFGIAFNVDSDEIGVVLLGECELLHAGDEVERTGRVMDVPVGDGMIGRVIDPLERFTLALHTRHTSALSHV